MWTILQTVLLMLDVVLAAQPTFVWPLSYRRGPVERQFGTVGSVGDDAVRHDENGPTSPSYRAYYLPGTTESYITLPVLKKPGLDVDVTFRFYVFPVRGAGVILHYKANDDKHDFTNGFLINLLHNRLEFLARAETHISNTPLSLELPLSVWTHVHVAYSTSSMGIQVILNNRVSKEGALQFYIGPLQLPGTIHIGEAGSNIAQGLHTFMGSVTCLQMMPSKKFHIDTDYDQLCTVSGSKSWTNTDHASTPTPTTTTSTTKTIYSSPASTTSTPTSTTITSTTTIPTTSTTTSTSTSVTATSSSTMTTPPTTTCGEHGSPSPGSSPVFSKAIYVDQADAESHSACRDFRKLDGDVTFADPDDVLREVLTEDTTSCLQYCNRYGGCETISMVEYASGHVKCVIGRITDAFKYRAGYKTFVLGQHVLPAIDLNLEYSIDEYEGLH